MKKRILVVDDESSLANLLKLGLQRATGHEVLTEKSGRRAVATAKAFQPDLVLLDVCLADDEGGRVAARMRNEPAVAHVPIIFLTGLLTRQRDVQYPIESGGYPYLPKPIDMTTLVRCIEEHLALPVLA